MSTGPVPVAAENAETEGGLLALALLLALLGGAVGLVGAGFRLALVQADHWRDDLIAWAHGRQFVGFLIVTAACAVAAGLAGWLVRRIAPITSGSGIPHIEAVLKNELPPAPFRFIPVKFVGGLLAIGSGLALGREGPTVQMGGGIGHLIGRIFRRGWPDCQVLLAAGAGAGLATAFNSPIAGAIFVLEELVRRFDVRTAIGALATSATAMSVARIFLGDRPDFHVQALVYPSASVRPLFFLLGALAGILGIAYNRALLGALAVADRYPGVPAELRAGAVGACIGSIAWFLPGLVGGGDDLTQLALDGMGALAVLPLLFLVRFGLGAVSYATGTPGGLFAPLLVLGAQLGLFFGSVCGLVFPDAGLQPTAFAVVGMAAFFTGVVRAPLTAIVLVIEMTGSFTMLLPMLGACCVAMLVPTLLGDPPIYDSLRDRTLR